MNSRLIFLSICLFVLIGKASFLSAQSFSATDVPQAALVNASTIDGGDYDGDGDLDLLVRWNDAGTWKAEIFRNTSTTGAISFVSSGIFLLNISGSCRWVDINNDGKLDILASGFNGTQNFLTAYINDAGTFSTQIPISSDLATSLDWGDVDADGDNDLLVTTSTESFLLTRTGAKTFTRLFTNSFSINSILADYDLDNDLDVVGDGIYSNRGDEFLETHALFPTPNAYDNLGNMHATDLDGDGDRDLIRGEEESPRGSTFFLAVAYYNDNNIFSRVPIDDIDDFSGSNVSPLGAFDFDNNGDVEIAYVMEGNRAEDFIRFREVKSQRLTTIVLPAFSRFHALGAYIIADFNGDQKLDIITTGSYVDTQTSTTVSYAKAYRNLTAAANAKPSVPANLGKTEVDNGVKLSWNRSTDATTPGPSITYNFYLRQGLDTLVSPYATKSGKPRISSIKGSFEANTYTLMLPNNGSYQWAVRAKDAAGNYSAFSAENSFEFTGGNSEVNHSTNLSDQSLSYDPKNDQYILVGIQNGNVYGILLDGKFGEKKSSLKKINQFTTVCKSPKVAVDSAGNYLVSWIGDSLSLSTSLWGKFVKSDLSFSQANEWRTCEKVFYGGITSNIIVSHDARYNPARNAFDMGWAYFGETGGTSVRRVRLQGNVAQRDPIKRITWTYVFGELHGASGYRDISLDSDPKSGKSMVVYTFEDERPEGGLTSLGKVFFQELDQNLNKVKDSIPALTFSYGSAPHILYNPYLRNFAVIWNAHFKHQATPLPQDGYNESRDVAAAILSFETNGSLITYIFPSTISKTQQQGGVGGALNPNLAFNYDRNEFLVSWFNTNANKIYGQRINAVDKVTVTNDEFQMKAVLSESPKAGFANKRNHFLLGFLQDGNGTTSVVEIPDDPAPQVVSLSKAKAKAGEPIIITGNNFGKTPFLNTVYFGSIKAKVDTLFWDRTKLQVTVPSGLTREKVPVVVHFDGQGSNTTVMFENITISGITSVVPLVGQPGEIITITGTNFPTDKNDFLVKFGPAVAALDDILDDNTETVIKVKVPQNAVRGPNQIVSIVIQGISNEFNGFQVVRIPSITSAEPTDGSELVSDKLMDIRGTNFSFEADDIEVKIGNDTVPLGNVKLMDATRVQVQIPRGIYGKQRIHILSDDGNDVSDDEYDFFLGADVKSMMQDTVLRFSNRTTDFLGLEVEVYNKETVGDIKFWTKGISEPESGWKSQSLQFEADENNSIFHEIEEAAFTDDPLGLEGYYEVLDVSTIVKKSKTFKVFRDYVGSGTTALIPDLRFGGNTQDYNIISIPYDLTPNNKNRINVVFKSVLDVYGFDKSKWRLIHYNNDDGSGEYKEYVDGQDEIEAGKGYWMIVRYPQDIPFEIGKTLHSIRDSAHVKIYGPYEIVLKPGWNQIGNPYDFNVSWDAIMEYNGDPATVETFKTFSNGSFITPGAIERYRGGFVRYNGADSLVLKVPFENPHIEGGRKKDQRQFNSKLDEKEWRIALDLSAGELMNMISSFGMHPQANEGVDERDEHKLPVFIQSLDLSFAHSLSTSIVGTDDHHTWDVEVLNTTDSKEVTLTWDNTSFGENDRELYLQDNVAQRIIDMRIENHYTFTYHEGYSFKIHFGDKSYVEEIAKPSSVVLSEAYPNPMQSSTRIPFTVVKDKTHVRLGIYTLQGEEIQTLVNTNFDTGFYEFEWDGKGPAGGEITSGVVIYRLQASEPGTSVKSYFKKLVITP